MLYTQARDAIKDGDLLAWSHYDWKTWYDLQIQVVRFGTQSEYCHVGLAHWHADRLWVIESVEPVIRMVPLSNLVGEHGFYWVPLQAPMTPKELDFACSKIGVGHYSKIEAVKAQLLEKLENQDDDHWECAKFVNACRRVSGIELGPKDTPAAVVERALSRNAPLMRVLPG